MEFFWIIAIVFVIIAIISGLRDSCDSGVPKTYRARACAGRRWRRRYPEASKQAIRQFLALFASAFLIKDKHVLCFEPDDELISIYRARYPSRLTPDALEFETLALELEEKYGLLLSGVWHEHLTLGDLFDQINAAKRL